MGREGPPPGGAGVPHYASPVRQPRPGSAPSAGRRGPAAAKADPAPAARPRTAARHRKDVAMWKIEDCDEMAELKARLQRVTTGAALRADAAARPPARPLRAAGGGAAAATQLSGGKERAAPPPPPPRPDGLPPPLPAAEPLLHLRGDTRAPARAFFIGNPLVDLSANVEFEFLQRYGLEFGAVEFVESDDREGLWLLSQLSAELSAATSARHLAGGSALNAARSCAWALGAKGSGAVSFAGAVGDDHWAEILLRNAARDRVHVVAFPQQGITTGLCCCAVTKSHSVKETWRELPDGVQAGESTLVATAGAGSLFGSAMLRSQQCAELMGAAEVIVVGGYLLCSSAGAAQRAAESAYQQGKVLLLLLGAPLLLEEYGDAVEELLPYVDVLFMNQATAEALAERLQWGGTSGRRARARLAGISGARSRRALPCAQIAARARDMAKRGGSRLASRVVVVSCGPLPTVVADGGGVREFPTPQVSMIFDTTGCGDAFAGGFLAGMLRGWDVAGCVTLGQLTARHVLHTRGVALPESAAPQTPDAAAAALAKPAVHPLSGLNHSKAHAQNAGTPTHDDSPASPPSAYQYSDGATSPARGKGTADTIDGLFSY